MTNVPGRWTKYRTNCAQVRSNADIRFEYLIERFLFFFNHFYFPA